MTEPGTPAGAAPTAETLKDRVDELGENSDLGVGDEEPDPVTAEAPPSDLSKGDEQRNPD
jgi:hypothetical protein